MQNISFGRVLKVNAPYYVADRIITMAQKGELQDNASTLLGNCKTAHSCYFSDDENKSYIFTGKDGERYWKSFNTFCDTMEYASKYYKGDDNLENAHIESAADIHKKNVLEIINSAAKIHELDVQYDEDKVYNQVDIKSLNIIV